MESPARHRPPVIADVARLAGVSVPTVSRVLNGSTPVSEHKRARVLSAIRTLGYRPNSAARALVTGRRSMIGVVTSNTTRFGYAATIQGVQEAARAAGLLVVITVVDSDDAEAAGAAMDLVLGQPVAGLIVLEFDARGAQVLESLHDSIPVAAVSSSQDGRAVPRALFDDRTGGWDATHYLLDLGHRNVHHVAVPGSGRPGGCTLGWREALEAVGAAAPDVIETDWTPQSGYRAGLELLGRDEVTAVLCGNDEIAFGVMKALQVSGVRVPDDVSVVGFDDHPHAALWSPPLTTMKQDFAALGRAAVGCLVDRLGGPSTPAEPVGAALRLVVRESSVPPRR